MAKNNPLPVDVPATCVQLASAQIIRFPGALAEKVPQCPGRIPKHIPRISDAQKVRKARADAQWRIQHRLNQIAMYQKNLLETEKYVADARAWIAHLIETPIREVLHARSN